MGIAQTIRWRKATTPDELHPILMTLAEEYPIRCGGSQGVPVRFERVTNPGTVCVQQTGNAAVIQYAAPSLALRGVSALMAGCVSRGRGLCEQTPFVTRGIMLDCSRNAVMTVGHFKRWLRRLALLGYNMAMLYTEDTYELPGEPFFGRLRGSYTADELRDIDGYAATLGIEMIPCIQTLGHLEHLLKWPAYAEVKDTETVLLVGEPQTYRLVEKMLKHWKSVFRSRRIHIGMDEAWDLGRGHYRARNGDRPGFDIFNEHLHKVAALCREHGLQPMIWSDMYFRLGSATGGYHDPQCRIPDAVVRKIPKSVELVYWDYYHHDPSFYADFIQRHRDMGFEPIMASGAWTWGKLWHDVKRTEETAGPCISACRRAGLKEIFFTLWGDDGAYCDFDSALAGLAWCAEQACAETYDEQTLTARFAAVCGADYGLQNLAASLEHIARRKLLGAKAAAAALTDPDVSDAMTLSPGPMLWDDPLLPQALLPTRPQWAKLESHYARLAKRLKPHTADASAGKIAHAALLAETLAAKLGLQRRLLEAYAARDRRRLAAVRRSVPPLVRLLERTAESLRSNWMARNKPLGFETVQLRLAGTIARYRELDHRLADWLAGHAQHVPELEKWCDAK